MPRKRDVLATEELGNEVATLRKKLGMSRAVLAGELGISASTISRWEAAKAAPEAGTLKKLHQLVAGKDATEYPIAKEIADIRRALGLSQGDLAEAIGAAQGSISKWESGKERPLAEALKKIQQLAGKRNDLDLDPIQSKSKTSIFPSFATIAETRRMKEMTQAELAERVGVHWITISKLERGLLNFSPKWVERLAQALDVPQETFLPKDHGSAEAILEVEGTDSKMEVVAHGTPDHSIEVLRQRISERMEERGENKSSVSLRAGFNRMTVRDILSGKVRNPGIFTIAAIAKVLDCTPAYLTGETDEASHQEREPNDAEMAYRPRFGGIVKKSYMLPVELVRRMHEYGHDRGHWTEDAIVRELVETALDVIVAKRGPAPINSVQSKTHRLLSKCPFERPIRIREAGGFYCIDDAGGDELFETDDQQIGEFICDLINSLSIEIDGATA